MIESMVAASIVSHNRFAINTFNIPLFKVIIQTSRQETITEIMTVSLNIGSYAYQKAVKAGKFGKLGKLVDLKECAIPPEAHTTIDYTKFGISGKVTKSEKLESVFYDCIDVEPAVLNCNPQNSCFHRTMDDLTIFMAKFDKKPKGRR